VITHVSVAVMYVRDQDASKAFYADRLGFEVVRDEEMFPGARWLELRPPEGQTTIVLSAAAAFGKQPGEGAFLHFACDDIHETVRELRDAGVTVTDPEEQPWGTFAKATDPDGHQVQIKQR
jgi:catechol 2,3-dioxygenase-like lactoylglutathione lyase family enzyme